MCATRTTGTGFVLLILEVHPLNSFVIIASADGIRISELSMSAAPNFDCSARDSKALKFMNIKIRKIAIPSSMLGCEA
jgi:hypothetical protein